MINTLVSNGKQHMWVPNLQYKHECFADDTPLMHNYIRDSSGVFSISSLVKISMVSLISSLSLELYFNSLVYDGNMFGSSSKAFPNLRTPSKNFGKYSGKFVWPPE